MYFLVSDQDILKGVQMDIIAIYSTCMKRGCVVIGDDDAMCMLTVLLLNYFSLAIFKYSLYSVMEEQ